MTHTIDSTNCRAAVCFCHDEGAAIEREFRCTACLCLHKMPVPEQLYGCVWCDCTDIQHTAWVEYNSGELLSGDPPTDDIFCPQCDRETGAVKVAKLTPYKENQ